MSGPTRSDVISWLLRASRVKTRRAERGGPHHTGGAHCPERTCQPDTGPAKGQWEGPASRGDPEWPLCVPKLAKRQGTLRAIRGRQLPWGTSLWWGGASGRSTARECGERGPTLAAAANPPPGSGDPHQEPSGPGAPLALGHPRTRVRGRPPLPSPTPGGRPRPSEPPPRSSRR